MPGAAGMEGMEPERPAVPIGLGIGRGAGRLSIISRTECMRCGFAAAGICGICGIPVPMGMGIFCLCIGGMPILGVFAN